MVEWINLTRNMVDNSCNNKLKLLNFSEAFFSNCDISINILDVSHLDQVLTLENNVTKLSSKRNPDTLLSFLNNYTCFGLFIKNQLVGFACFSSVFEQSELLDIMIDDSFSNKKLSYSLLSSCFYYLKEQNIETIFLEVSQDNKNAIKLYSKFNPIQLNIRKNYYKNIDGSISNAIIFNIKLI